MAQRVRCRPAHATAARVRHATGVALRTPPRPPQAHATAIRCGPATRHRSARARATSPARPCAHATQADGTGPPTVELIERLHALVEYALPGVDELCEWSAAVP
eukprot:7095597-Prymnesium_polylepis.1